MNTKQKEINGKRITIDTITQKYIALLESELGTVKQRLAHKEQLLADRDAQIYMINSLKIFRLWRLYIRIREGSVPHRAKYYYNRYKNSWRYKAELKTILAGHKNAKGVIIYPPSIDWHLPLYQRPQHIASNLATLGYLCFYGTSNTYDKVHGFEKLQENLYVTDQFDAIISTLKTGWIIVHAGHPTIPLKLIASWKAKGFSIVYEYMDEINEDIAVDAPATLKRHRTIEDQHIDKVIVTASKLYDEMKKKVRPEKILLNPNGVDFQHFSLHRQLRSCPKDLIGIVQTRRPIIGYYGALAKWIDYDIINAVALAHADWHIVLIGWDFEGSMKKLKEQPNIHNLGLKDYAILPRYAIWFDVAMIPFKNGRIAQGTSPIKLFEYFALQKCVVVTKDLIECMPYKGVFVANSKTDFILKIEQALRVKDNPRLLAQLSKQARDNTWIARAKDIDNFLSQEE